MIWLRTGNSSNQALQTSETFKFLGRAWVAVLNPEGQPDRVVEGEGYTLEFIGPTLLCLDVLTPSYQLTNLPGQNTEAVQCPYAIRGFCHDQH